MKNRFLISEEEKSRILGLHEQSTSIYPNIPKFNIPSANQKLIDDANKWLTDNQNILKYNVDQVNEILNGKVTGGEITSEILPWIKAAIQSQSQGKITFKPEEMGGQPTQPQTTQVQPSSTFKMGVKNDKVTQIQTKLNEKFKAGLVVDGLWGPKTAAAVAKYLPQLKQPVTNTTPNTTTDDDTLV
jgi:hypothetical protein